MSKLSLKKCQQIEIDAADPFKNDVLNRKANVEILTQFITSYEQSIVLCIDAGWGQGKTTFIKMWQQSLKNLDIPTIYFNAWESDYTDDALIALIGEIGLSIQELTGEDKTTAEKIIGRIYKFAANFTKAAAPTMANLGIKAASGGLISADEISTAFGNLSESLVKEQITKYEESRKTLGSFKEALSELARCYADGDAHKPLVIFIDELDRCRPNFAIEVLEKAKHLFNVDNIIFVLATDKTQLGHSIRAVYGQGLDVNGYLRRFIDFDYLLPSPVKSDFIISLAKQLGLSEDLNIKLPYHNYTLLNLLKDITHLYKLTLREQEALCNILNIIVRTNNHLTKEEYTLLFLLIILKLKFPDLYKSLNRYNTSKFISNVLENINSQYSSDTDNDIYYFEFLECMLLSVIRPASQFSYEETINDYVRKYNFNDVKKQKLIHSFDMVKGFEITIQDLLIIKNAIEISSSFRLN
ncbi:MULTISPECIES: KAP family P-loop NTPase fold protein [Snodgrassella]|uniref:KAP family P-loop NTPase fold protein n=1 Tax=Snodgrassella TaxID=1193515 RepID=UPI0008157ACB|nr:MULTISPECIES: P-loop NTPase fold protein [Snodgrassella]SCC14004.1 KAP family P-loop domain-containing protein [Snodgrassella sp. R-53583]